MHRLVMGLEKHDGLEVDHVFHITYDNRKEYLRIVTPSQNKMNKNKQNNNTSGVRGVWYNKNTGKWAADIGINNKIIHIGEYVHLEDAANARKDAENKYFKEYNFQGEGWEAYDKY